MTVQLRGERDRFLDRPERDIPEMQHHICRTHRLVPAADERGVHLVDGGEWTVRELADPGVAEVGVRGDEVDPVEVEPRILAHVCASRSWGVLQNLVTSSVSVDPDRYR